MATTQEILDAADKLGKLVAEHDSARKLEELLKRLESNQQAQRALTDYNRHLQTLAEKQQQGQPIEVEDKRKLEQLQQAVATDPTLRELQMVQMDYVDLLRKIDEKITGEAPTAGQSPLAGAGPAG